MSSVVAVVLPVFGLIAIGAFASWRRWLGREATEGLNLYVIWLALPALLFGGAAKMSWTDLDHPGFVAAAAGGMLVTFVLSLLLDRRGGERRLADRVVDGLAASYPNNGYLGIPLAFGLFGPSILPALVISMMLTAILMFGLAIVVIEIDLAAQPSLARTLRTAGVALVRNPLLIAPLAGLVWAATGHPLPAPLDRFVTLLSDSAGPCALVTIGLFLAQQERVAIGGHVARLTVLKLVGQPLVTFAIARFVAMPADWFDAALLLAALPTGTGPFMIATLYDRDAEASSRTILLSTVVSVVTVSLLIISFGRIAVRG